MQTEVGSTSDILESDGGWSSEGSDDDVLVDSETLWDEEDILNEFVETRKKRNLGIETTNKNTMEGTNEELTVVDRP